METARKPLESSGSPPKCSKEAPSIWEVLGRRLADRLWPAAELLQDDGKATEILRLHFADHLAALRWGAEHRENCEICAEGAEFDALRLLLAGLRAGLAERA